MGTVTISIPATWLPDSELTPAELREALRLGLAQLKQEAQSNARLKGEISYLLEEAGLIAPPSAGHATPPPLSPADRLTLAERAATNGGPLSESIIADRADRV
jgi:hypothetical protein